MSLIITAMRRVDMVVRHPKTDYSHVCSQCGAAVGLYPPTVKLLAKHPDTVLVCNRCDSAPPSRMISGAEDEIGESAAVAGARSPG